MNLSNLMLKDSKKKLSRLLYITALSTCSVFAYAQQQPVHLTGNNLSLKTIFKQIEKQTDLSIDYKIQDIDDSRIIKNVPKASTIQLVMEQLLDGTDCIAIYDSGHVIIRKQVIKEEIKQTKEIKGVVLDTNGEPIIGATIMEKGTNNGTITDINGQFKLEVLTGSIIQVSYIGLANQEVKINNQTNISITMKEDSEMLDELVVVGFGTQKKVNLTGAVGTVDSEVLENRPVMTATQALQGVVPGLQITQNSGNMENRASINIRGIATIGEGSSGSPLVLIDGMEGDINTINPQDIDNISVLKDAASSSIYGSRAPFGVILITTKKGKTGKPVLNYNNSIRFNSPLLLPESVDSYTFALFMNDGCINGGITPFFSTEHLQRIKDYQNGVIKESIIPNPDNPTKWGDGYVYGNDNVDWFDAIFRSQAFSHEHNLSLNGGTDSSRYYVSANYLDQDGFMEFNQDNYKRFASTVKLDIDITKWLKFGYNARFIREDFQRPSDLTGNLYYYLVIRSWPTLPLYDPNGYLYDSPTVALGLRDGGRDKRITDNLYQQAHFTIEPIRNWRTFLDVNYKIEHSSRHWDYQKTYNHDVSGEPYPYRNSSHVHEDYSTSNFMNINVYTEYSKELKTGHYLKGMLGFQSELMKYKVFGLQSEGIILPSKPLVDLTTGLDAYGKEVKPSVNGSEQDWATAGFFGRVNYNYKERYLAELNLRYDGTSRFIEDQRWKLFTSFSLGWNLAKENFWKSIVEHVNMFKIRGSYGELGNQNTSNWYPTYQIMPISIASGTWIMNGSKPNISTAPQLVSSLMTWERINTWDIGLDFGILDNRLTGSIDYFMRKTLDMIGPAPELPGTLGTSVPVMNNTDLKSYGFDLSISWNDRLHSDLGYSIKFILSDAQTEITRYPNETGNLYIYRKGMKMGEIWGYQTIGIAKSNEEMDSHLASLPNGAQDALGSKWEAGDIMFADLNKDGKIDSGANTLDNHGDLKIIGNSTPRFQFGLDFCMDYKGFDFRAFFQGVMKRDYFQNSTFFWGSGNGVYNSTCQSGHLDYFRNDFNHPLGLNLESYFPRPDFSSEKNHQVQTAYLQNAAYIRFKNLQLGYTFPQRFTEKFAISKLRAFISGENLWTVTSLFDNFDPETIDGGWGGNVYPLSKVFSLGVSINF